MQDLCHLLKQKTVNMSYTSQHWQGTKIFQYCTCPAGRVTYNFHSSCKHTHLSFKSVCNKEHKGVIWLPWVILPKALVLQDECFGKNYSYFLDFTRNYERTSGIFVPWLQCRVQGSCNQDFVLLKGVSRTYKSLSYSFQGIQVYEKYQLKLWDSTSQMLFWINV